MSVKESVIFTPILPPFPPSAAVEGALQVKVAVVPAVAFKTVGEEQATVVDVVPSLEMKSTVTPARPELQAGEGAPVPEIVRVIEPPAKFLGTKAGVAELEATPMVAVVTTVVAAEAAGTKSARRSGREKPINVEILKFFNLIIDATFPPVGHSTDVR